MGKEVGVEGEIILCSKVIGKADLPLCPGRVGISTETLMMRRRQM